MGGKSRIGKQIANLMYQFSTSIEDEYDFVIRGYCEPFCGMLGVYRHVPELFQHHKPALKYRAGDLNKSVVLMWKAAQKGWTPPTRTTERKYNALKRAPESALKGYIGHQYSFGGQYFQGYAPKYGKTANSSAASKRVVDIGRDVRRVSFRAGSYGMYSNLSGYIIYCDPPYANTKCHYSEGGRESKIDSFDTNAFFDWCREMSRDNIVFISSYSAPKDFQCIFKSSHRITGVSPTAKKKSRNRKRVEKLYVMY